MRQRGLRHLVLTLKNQKNLNKGVTHFYESFTRFKRRKYFKDNIFGGIGSIETKKRKNGLWNTHGHFLIDSKFLDMKSHKISGGDSKLVQEWKESSRGSKILFIKKVRDHQDSLNYVLKYLVKGIKDLTPEQKADFFKATFNRRLIFTFGSFYGIKRPNKLKRFQYIKPFSDEYNSYLKSIENESPTDLEDWFKQHGIKKI